MKQNFNMKTPYVSPLLRCSSAPFKVSSRFSGRWQLGLNTKYYTLCTRHDLPAQVRAYSDNSENDKYKKKINSYHQQKERSQSKWSFFLKWIVGAFALLIIFKLEGVVDVEPLVQPFLGHCDNRPRSPLLEWPTRQQPAIPAEPAPPQPEPVVLPPPVIPELAEPLFVDDARMQILYRRYTALSAGSIDGGNLNIMIDMLDLQLRIEKRIEAALVDDGFDPRSILRQYTNIRGAIHSPRGSLLSLRTYQGYENQILQGGTRQSVPYRRLIQLIHNNSILLYRR